MGEGEEADTDDPGVEESFALLCEFEVLGEYGGVGEDVESVKGGVVG